MRFFSRMRALRLCFFGLIFLLPSNISLAEEAVEGEDTIPAQKAAPSTNAPADVGNLDQLLNLAERDVGQLSQVKVTSSSQSSNLSAPSNQLDVTSANAGEVSSVGELLRQVPSVNARRTSALNLDPRVRGYNSAQLNATANGMNQLKTRVDIDSLFSQIDPGIVDNISVIDGPYTSLYGPGFAFLIADLISPPRFSQPETHLSTNFVYGSNAQTLYTRDNMVSGSKDWGVILSYGLRVGNDYLTGGGPESFMVPSSYQEWNGFLSTSYDINKVSRIEFDYLRTDMNDVELPGVVYDINSSVNNQFNLRYIIQEDRQGPEQFLLQSWWNQTYFKGDASRLSKQESFYQSFVGLSTYMGDVGSSLNTFGRGHLLSLGVRGLRTFGDADSVQWTIGADWRRYEQQYYESDYWSGGQDVWWDPWGIPRSRMDDVGALTDLLVPLSDRLSVNIGGRVDGCRASADRDDIVITKYDPWGAMFPPGFQESTHTIGMAYITGKYKLSDTYTLRAGTAFAERMPDLQELYVDEPFVPLYRLGNSFPVGLQSLQPEKNLQLDLGLDYKTEKVFCGLRAYYAMIRDYIMPVAFQTSAWVQDGVVFPKALGRDFTYVPPEWRADLNTPNENGDFIQAGYQYVNIDLATLLGGDLYSEVKMSDWCAVYGTISYIYGTNESPVNFTQVPYWYSPDGHVNHLGGTDGLPGIYPLNGTIGVRIFQSEQDRWCLDFCARMVRKQDHVAETVDEIPAPGFTIFNLRGYYRVNKNVKLNAEIQNLFNRYYIEPGSLAIIGPNGIPTFLPEPGISAIIGVDARF